METIQTNKRYITEAAICAKEIRKIIKKEFPTTKFKVHYSNFSMGDAVDVSYTNGPYTSKVEKCIEHFQEGHFDGMTDCYEYDNDIKGLPQTKYLHVNRHMSEEVRKDLMEKLEIPEAEENSWNEKHNCWNGQFIWRRFQEREYQ